MIFTKFKTIVLSLITIVVFNSCEDVIEVEVPQTPPRLSIDGLVRLDASQANTTVSIKASLTSNFFGETTPQWSHTWVSYYVRFEIQYTFDIT